MDYEKAYKKALERARNVHKYSSDIAEIKRMEYIFSELAESEDDKIRNFISNELTCLRATTGKGSDRYEELTNAIAWLEKQAEQKSIDYNEELKKCRKNPLYFFDKYVKLEERKSADKVESKFHEGDWVANDYCVGKVIALTDDAYLLDSGQGIPFSCEHNAHLWTIKDAKPGDVLCCESGWTCIFKTLNSDNISFSSYCFMDNTGWFCETGSESHTLEKAFIKAYNGNIYPATKEQRDLLFQKMHEASFVWDAEKKELKKIEQKSAWSEEDESMYTRTLGILGKCYMGELPTKVEEELNWFKSLRHQINVTDEELAQAKKDAYNEVLDKIEYHDDWPTFDDGWNAAIWYLKKRNDRPQSHWTPSDA